MTSLPIKRLREVVDKGKLLTMENTMTRQTEEIIIAGLICIFFYIGLCGVHYQWW
tara:strand:- start:408 stop:572 length:165 start_codon:yes stop_codon:yes gene_type:complete